MAQIKSALGVIRGKVGNNIFAKRGKTNVVYLQGKDTNESSTDPQILVRAKMRPASSTYQKLQQILNHSFNRQSVLLSRNDFMSFALRSEFFPYLEKGYVGAAIPGDYRITAGALNTITAQVDSEGIRTNIVVPAGAVMTGASIVNAEENADMIADKDQLTWIMFGVDAYDTPRWFYTRTNIENTEDPLPVSFSASNGFLRIGKPANMQTVLAGCVIRTNLGNTFLYSSEKLELNEDLFTEKYMDANSYMAMLRSYKKGTTAQSSDLYLDELAGDQPDTDSLPKYTTKLVKVQGEFNYPEKKSYWASVYAVSFAGKQYILTAKKNNLKYCVNPKGAAMGVVVGEAPGTVKTVWYNQISPAYRDNFDGTWDIGELDNIDPEPTPTPVHGMFIVSTVDGENKFVKADGGRILGEPATSTEDAVRIITGEAVSVQGTSCNYLKDAETGENLEINGNPVVRVNAGGDDAVAVALTEGGVTTLENMVFSTDLGYFSYSESGEQAYIKAL